MNTNKLIRTKLQFLEHYGYTCSHIHEKNLYHFFRYQKDVHQISVNYDMCGDFLNLIIRNGTYVQLETVYDRIVIDGVHQDISASSRTLKETYARQRISYSLSAAQIANLLDLYADWSMQYLKKTDQIPADVVLPPAPAGRTFRLFSRMFHA